MYEVQNDVSLNARLDSLTRKVDALVLSQTMKVESQVQQDACNVAASPMHNAMVCPLRNQEGISEQVNAMNQFRKSFSSPYSETYNPNKRNHPSWRQLQSQPNQVGPPGFNQFCPASHLFPYALPPDSHMVCTFATTIQHRGHDREIHH